MSIITIEKLQLLNFKGIKSLSLDFGASTSIYGDNATGKTTIFDAFLWLLFDKDSQNKKDFELKPLDAQGNPLHNVDSEVTGTLCVNGRVIILRKVYAEKWTKRRGSAQSEFSGHTTDYFVDGVPTQLKEYKARVSELVDEDLFKLLTSPTYFNEVLPWQKRREILLSICGDLTDEEVIAADKSLKKLPDILNGRALDDHRKVITARRTEINKELDKLPVRIDEAERSKPKLDGMSEVDSTAIIDSLRATVAQKEAELNRLQSGGEIAEQQVKLREVEGQILTLKNEFDEGALTKAHAKRVVIHGLESERNRLLDDANRYEAQIQLTGKYIERAKQKADQLRIDWADINKEIITAAVDDTCTACGQSLPTDRVEAAREKAIADFNRRKASRLEEIVSAGRQAKQEVEELTIRQSEERSVLAKATEAAEALGEKIARENAELQKIVATVGVDPMREAQMNALVHAKEAIEAKMQSLRSSSIAAVDAVRNALMDARDDLRRAEQRHASFAQVIAIDKRIAELSAQEKSLAAEYERLEEELYLTEEFIRVKVNLLESRINAKFRYARFKLFEQQINGALSETCQTTYNGVPYGSGLNNAARINVGLDIIQTLSEHYGLSVPVIIDNRESVVRLMDIDTQVISLIVSAADKELRVETQTNDYSLDLEAM